MANRVDTNIPAAAVRRSPEHDDIDPHEPLVRRHDGEPGRLGDDRGVGAHAVGYEPTRSQTRVLFVDDGGDNDLAVDRRRGACGGRAHRSDAGLHVRGATAVQAAVSLRGVPGRVHHPVHADDVDVPVEHQ